MSWLREARSSLGTFGLWAALAAVALGAGAFVTALAGDAAPSAFGALIACWLFFAGAAVGAAAFRALFRVIRAGWAQPLGTLAGVLASFLPAAAVVLLVILAGAVGGRWIAEPSGWLAPPLLIAREAVLSAALFGLAYAAFRGRDEAASPSLRASVVYLLLFCCVLSIWAFDFVLGPVPTFGSTLAGPYLFVGSFVAGAGLVILLGVARGALTDEQRLDASAMVLTLTIFWAYLFWSQYLHIWYANLPDEVAFALRRSIDGWNAVVLAVVFLVFAVPFLALLRPDGRRSRRVLMAVLSIQLVGLWLNCILMVVPSLSQPGSPPLGLRGLLIAAGVLGVFALSVAPSLAPKRA